MRLLLIATLVLASAASAADAPEYHFRSSERPVFDRTVSPAELDALAAKGAVTIDVRLAEDFAKDPNLIPGAVRRDPDAIATWTGGLPRDRPIVVYCVKGAWVSQKAATYLRGLDRDVYSLNGGMNAWRAARQSPILPR